MDNVFGKDDVFSRIICTAFFLLFTFLYLYNYQADLLAMGQHVLSGGKTTYNSLVGALLITIALYVIHLGVCRFSTFMSRYYALSYFPSLLLLGMLTDISPNIDKGFSFGDWLWAFPLLIALWAVVVWLVYAVQPYEPVNFSHGLFSRVVWANVLQMCLMFLFVGAVCNSDEVFHYRMSVERHLARGEYDKALEVGNTSQDTDSSLTMLRIYALAATYQLPNRLFAYPLVGGSKAMRPNGESVKMMYYGDTQLRRVRRSKGDYILCGYLLDKNIDAFAHEIKKWYDMAKPLPKHYREALTLYCHMRSNPVVTYSDDVCYADFRDYQEMERNYPDVRIRQNMLRDTFGKSYWYYYDYGGR